MTSENVEIEGKAGFQHVSQGGDSIWELGLGLGMLVHFPTTTTTHTFIRFGGTFAVAGFDDDSYSQVGLGATLGSKLAMGSQWAFRAEFGGERKFETDYLRGRWDLGATIGFSFFTNSKSQ